MILPLIRNRWPLLKKPFPATETTGSDIVSRRNEDATELTTRDGKHWKDERKRSEKRGDHIHIPDAT